MHQKYSQLAGQNRDFCQLCHPFHLSGAGILPNLLLAQVSFQHSNACFCLLYLLQKGCVHLGEGLGVDQARYFVQI